jgi:hypothetical protein
MLNINRKVCMPCLLAWVALPVLFWSLVLYWWLF